MALALMISSRRARAAAVSVTVRHPTEPSGEVCRVAGRAAYLRSLAGAVDAPRAAAHERAGHDAKGGDDGLVLGRRHRHDPALGHVVEAVAHEAVGIEPHEL